jgi:hypothetical protein
VRAGDCAALFLVPFLPFFASANMTLLMMLIYIPQIETHLWEGAVVI